MNRESGRKLQIKHRRTGAVLYEHDFLEGLTVSGLLVRDALESACTDGASLNGADLVGANLMGADLDGVYLDGANLVGADLRDANLVGANLVHADLAGASLIGANLDSANLSGANLLGANLFGAYLRGANLRHAKLDCEHLVEASPNGNLVGERPCLLIWPFGSRSDSLVAFVTDDGVWIRAGHFSGDLPAFRRDIAGGSVSEIHIQECIAALALIETHVATWATRTGRTSATKPRAIGRGETSLA